MNGQAIASELWGEFLFMGSSRVQARILSRRNRGHVFGFVHWLSHGSVLVQKGPLTRLELGMVRGNPRFIGSLVLFQIQYSRTSIAREGVFFSQVKGFESFLEGL